MIAEREVLEHLRRFGAVLGTLHQRSRDEAGEGHRLALTSQPKRSGERLQGIVRLFASHDVKLALDETVLLPPPTLSNRIGHEHYLLSRAFVHKQCRSQGRPLSLSGQCFSASITALPGAERSARVRRREPYLHTDYVVTDFPLNNLAVPIEPSQRRAVSRRQADVDHLH